MFKKLLTVLAALAVCVVALCACNMQTTNDCTLNAEENATDPNQFPDGSQIDPWFKTSETVSLETMGQKLIVPNLVANNISDEVITQNTQSIQQTIDTASNNGGGVVYISGGTYSIGALFFKPNVNLYIEEGSSLKGSEDIYFYPLVETRIEGQTCQYYSALINADKCDNFKIAGKGAIDGNGHKA